MTTSSKIPFLDLATPHVELEDELVRVFRGALSTAGFIGGPAVENFEREFARFCNAPYSVGVSSGTDALRFALAAAGVVPGDVVVTVPNTFIATTEAISQVGAQPEFVDVDRHTYTMDPEKLGHYLENQCEMDAASGRLISRRSRRPVSAIVPVHLYGQMADMDPIMELAQRYELVVVEDACQAHGAKYFSVKQNGWKKPGSMGKAAAYSFYPGKNLGACGEGGAVTVNDESMVRQIRMLREHGSMKKYYHEMEGYNGRLDAIQAGILSVKLAHLAEWNGQRRRHAQRYHQLLAVAEGAVIRPHEPSWSEAVYHLYVIRVSDRDGLLAHLAEAGIGAGIHYPVPLHLQKAYAPLGYATGDIPVCEKCAGEIVSLPMFPQLTEAQQDRVVEAVLRFVEVEDEAALTPIAGGRQARTV
jgi:dTDP-4-amino-4,6-dideoxygalactose transaminase